MTARYKSEQGAILIYVAVTMLVLVGVTMWVVDYGVLLLARNQAQNSADAGALGGAIAMVYDDFTDRTDTGPAKLSAHALALDNDVIGEDPIVDITTDVYFYPDDPTKFPAVCADDSCIRVDVYRNQARGNPLPMFFGATVGLTEQGVWATAIAHAGFGNASDCMLPFGVPDKWIDNYDTTAPIDNVWTQDDTFQKADETGGAPPDVYIAPSDLGGDPVSPNTSFSVDPAPGGDLGQLLVLKAGGPQAAIAPGVFFPVRLPLAELDPIDMAGIVDGESALRNASPCPRYLRGVEWFAPGSSP